LQHPNIVQIHEVGDHNGLPYFSLEFCTGGSLEKKLAGTPLPPREAAALVETLAHAMQAAHDKGVIHRDLKPANVLLADDGTPKITDFGLAKKLDEAGQTQDGKVMGTPSYMAPEQAGGKSKELGPPCDIYALGAVLYECLTGRPPFRAATPLDTVLQVVSEEPVPPTQLNRRVPRDLETITLKCLQKEMGKRYGSADALADELQAGGLDVLTGGTDTHLIQVDLRRSDWTGKDAEERLAEVRITANRNTVPFDERKPTIASGVRMGTPACTMRGFDEEDFREVARISVEALGADPDLASLTARSAALCERRPLYPGFRGWTTYEA
jgi:serine/threonine protein kinase